MTRSSRHEVGRFLVGSAANTLLTYLLYLALLWLVAYPWAYSISYVAGIFLSFVVNSLYVFRTPLRWRRLLPYPLVYVAQYLVGLSVTYAGVELVGIDERLVPLAVLAVTVPLSFVATRWILGRRSRRDQEASPVPPTPGTD